MQQYLIEFAIQFTLIFITLAAIYMGIRYAFRRWWPDIKKAFSTNKHHFTSVIMAQHHLRDARNTFEEDTARAQAISRFVEQSGSTKFQVRSSRESTYLPDAIKAILDRDFTVTVSSQFCRIGNRHCLTVLDITGASGTSYFMGFASYSTSFLDEEKRRIWITAQKSASLEEYVTDANEIVIGRGLELVYPVTIEDNNDELALIMKALDTATVNRIHYPHRRDQMTRIYRLGVGFAGLKLDVSHQAVAVLPDEEMDSMFMPVKVNYNGEAHEVSTSRALDVAVDALIAGENLSIRGIVGTGKTSASKQLQALLNEEKGVRCIVIQPTVFEQLGNVKMQSEFINMLDPIQNENDIVNIIFIDEAETILKGTADGLHSHAHTFLLSLLDGDIRKQINARVVMIFNADKSVLNGAAFRAGRAGSLELVFEPLDKNHAYRTINLLKKQLPNKIFDEQQFERLLSSDNYISDGKGGSIKYAQSGHITLADLANCFRDRTVDFKIMQAIRKAAGLPELPTPVAAKPLTAPKVKVVALPGSPQAKEQAVRAAPRPNLQPSSAPSGVEATPEAAAEGVNNASNNGKKKHKHRGKRR